MQDLEVAYSVGEALANGGQWPNWYEGNPFKAARDQLRAGTPATTAAP